MYFLKEIAMMKWSAVRGHELPKIRDVQVYVFDNLPHQGFCGLRVSWGLTIDLFPQVHGQLSAYGWCIFPLLVVSFLPNPHWFLSQPPHGDCLCQVTTTSCHQSPLSLSLSPFNFGEYFAQCQLLHSGNRSFSWLSWVHVCPTDSFCVTDFHLSLLLVLSLLKF